MAVPKASKGSWDELLHRVTPENGSKIVLMNSLRSQPITMQARGHRAIGVVYNPGSERGNYVSTVLPQRYDALLFIDKTTALRPVPITGKGIRRAEQARKNSIATIND